MAIIPFGRSGMPASTFNRSLAGNRPAALAGQVESHVSAMERNYEMPDLRKASRGQAIRANADASRMQAQALIAKDHSRAQQKQVQAYMDYLKGNLSHQQFMMKAQSELAREQAKHGNAVARHEFQLEKTQASFDAYQGALNNALGVFGG